MDLSKMMEMAQQMQKQLADAQQEAAKVELTGEAGGGLVKVTMNGRHEVSKVCIDPNAVDPNDLVLLEDLVRAATNQASARIAEHLKSNMGGMAQNLGVDLKSLGIDL